MHLSRLSCNICVITRLASPVPESYYLSFTSVCLVAEKKRGRRLKADVLVSDSASMLCPAARMPLLCESPPIMLCIMVDVIDRL